MILTQKAAVFTSPNFTLEGDRSWKNKRACIYDPGKRVLSFRRSSVSVAFLIENEKKDNNEKNSEYLTSIGIRLHYLKTLSYHAKDQPTEKLKEKVFRSDFLSK